MTDAAEWNKISVQFFKAWPQIDNFTLLPGVEHKYEEAVNQMLVIMRYL